MTATTSISVSELINLTQGIATLNLGYLTICVTIILFAGGLFYVFNFRPLQKSIEKTEAQLGAMTKEIDSKLENINQSFNDLLISQTKELRTSIATTANEINDLKKDAYERIENAEKKTLELLKSAEDELQILKKQNQENKLQTFWNEHYMWEGKRVFANALLTLIQYMETALDYKISNMTNLWLDRMVIILDQVSVTDKQQYQIRISNILGRLTGKEEKIEKVRNKLK